MDYKIVDTTNYYTMKQVPPPMYLGSDGDSCKTIKDCHYGLYCNEGTCGQWIPPQTVQFTPAPSIEKFQSVPGEEYYTMSPDSSFPVRTHPSRTLQYTSKVETKTGKNYW